MQQEIQLLNAQIAAMSRMEYQVVTTFTPGGRLHRTEQFARRQGRETSPLAAPPLTLAAAVSSPAGLGAPAMTIAQQGPPQIRFPRTLCSVRDLYQLWRHGLATMPSVDELEKRRGSRWRLRNERQLFSMRKVVIDKVVRLANVKGWSEEDAVQEVEKQRIEGGNLSLDALAKQLKAARRAGGER